MGCLLSLLRCARAGTGAGAGAGAPLGARWPRAQCALVVAVDYTSSNARNGTRTNGGRPLHMISLAADVGAQTHRNPYEEALYALEPLHAALGAPAPVRVLGFGDAATRDRAVFDFIPPGSEGCATVADAVARYREITPELARSHLRGPTSFVPAVEAALERVRAEARPHVLVIVTDGDPTLWDANVLAVMRASSEQLYIVAVGVGDAQFALLSRMERAEVARRVFANFSFLSLTAERFEERGGVLCEREGWRARAAARICELVGAQAAAREAALAK